jgi:hypothetical protein
MAYPVEVSVVPAVSSRNRLTTGFRVFLAIPHLILVGGVGSLLASNRDDRSGAGEGGLLGVVALVLAVVSWFSILIAGTHLAQIRQFTRFYLRWRVRAVAYLMLLQDPYPPFGDGPYLLLMVDDYPPFSLR